MPSPGRRRGKEHERAMVRALGGRRVGPSGLATMDVDHPLWAIECKERQTPHPGYVLAALAQARGAARAEQVPIAVFHQHGDRHSNDLVVMTLSDFVALHGAAGIGRGQDD